MERTANKTRDAPKEIDSDSNRASTTESGGSVAHFLEIENSNEEHLTTPTGWSSLFAFAKRSQLVVLIAAVVTGIASGLIRPTTTIFLGKVFQAFTDFGGHKIEAASLKAHVKTNSLILAGLGSADWLFSALFLFLWVLFGELQALTARNLLFDGLLAKSASFYDAQPSGIGALATNIHTYIKDLQLATAQPLGYVVSSLASTLLSFIIALKFEWRLTFILVAPLPFNAAVLRFISSRMRTHIVDQLEHLQTAAQNATNAFSAIETIKCLNGQVSEFNKFDRSITQAAVHYLRQVRGNALEIGYLKCLTLLTYMFGFWYGGHLVISGQRTSGDIITTFFSCLEITSSIQNILPQLLILNKGCVSGSILQRYICVAPRGSTLGDGKRPWSCKGEIYFNNVTFAYPACLENRVLRDMTCSFSAGRTTFVIGHSGSGKSSMTELLLKFYQPQFGEICVDGTPLCELDTLWLRNNLTIVQQQSVFFDGTIFENIAIGKHDANNVTINDVQKAAEFALLLNTVSNLPDGFDTRIGTKGHSLSGGQRQRMALARARLRDTPILILDESTSALDLTSRSLIVSAIREWRRNKTTIFITHDISLIENSDLVCLFEDGSVVQAGPRSAIHSSQAFHRYLKRRTRAVVTPTENKSRISSTDLSSGSSPEPLGDYKTENVGGRLARSEDSGLSYQFSSSKSQSHRKTSLSSRPWQELSDSVQPVINKISWHERSCVQDDFKNFKESPIANSQLQENIDLQMLETSGKLAVESRRGAMRQQNSPKKVSIRKNSIASSRNSSLRKILGTVWPALNNKRRQTLILGFICALLHSAAMPIFSWVFSKLVSTFYMKYGASQEALKWSLSILGLSLADGAACAGMHVLYEYSAHAWIDKIRKIAMRRILCQPCQFFADEGNSPSRLAYCLGRNAEEMRNILGRFFAFAVIAVVMMTVTILWCLVVCWKLTLVGLAVTPLSWAITRAYQIVSERFEGKSNDAGEAAAAVLNETVVNIKTIRGLTMEPSFRKKHSACAKRAFNVGLKRAFYSGIFFGLSQAITVLNNSPIFYYGALLAAAGTASVQDILLVFSQLLFALGNVTAIVALIPQVASSKDSATRLLDLTNLPQRYYENSGNISPLKIGDIVFNNLSFAYPSRSGVLVLHNLDLKVRQGSTTVLVGPSGSGKSTIASLLLKLYPLKQHPNRAPMISIDGRDMRRISTKKLRELVALVPQTPVMFPGTLKNNIAYGLAANSSYRNMESIQAAAISSGLEDMVKSLPNGYDTVIGDGGIELSGGQAQRVAIARALIRRPSVLILDEATSALDVQNAAFIRETIQRLKQETPSITVIIITHSEEMMHLADRLVLLEQGRIVEEGSFEELASRQGEFAKLLNGGLWNGGSPES